MVMAEGRLINIQSNLCPFIVDVPSYVKDNNKVDVVDIKLQILLKKCIDLLNNPLISNTKIDENERYFFESVIDMSNYIMNNDKTDQNVTFLYDLLISFFDFVEKIIQHHNKLIKQDRYTQLFDEYNSLLIAQEELFNKEIICEDPEPSEEYFNKLDTENKEYTSFESFDELKQYIDGE